MDSIGKRIVHHRKRLNLTQEQLAEKLGVTAQAVSKWENDQSCPDIAMLPQLAEIFGVTTDALLGRETPVYEAEIVQPEKEEKGNFEFHWDGGRKHAVGFAVLVLAVGALYMCSQLLSWGMSLWDVLWPTALLVFGFFNLWPRFSFFSMGCVLLGGYFLLQRWLPLPENIDSGVIWAGLIVLFGISLLADALRKPKKPKYSMQYNGDKSKAKRNLEIEDGEFTYDASFSDDTALISIDNLTGGEASCSFGNYVLDLSDVNHVESGCNVELDCSFGQLTVLIPRRFAAVVDNSVSFASVETIGRPDDDPLGRINLNCDCSFGSIHIKYI